MGGLYNVQMSQGLQVGFARGTDRSQEEDKVSPSSFPSATRKVTLPASRCHPHPAKSLVGSCEWLVNSCNQGAGQLCF